MESLDYDFMDMLIDSISPTKEIDVFKSHYSIFGIKNAKIINNEKGEFIYKEEVIESTFDIE